MVFELRIMPNFTFSLAVRTYFIVGVTKIFHCVSRNAVNRQEVVTASASFKQYVEIQKITGLIHNAKSSRLDKFLV